MKFVKLDNCQGKQMASNHQVGDDQVNGQVSDQINAATIVIKPFLDAELEIYGWYALGHHDPQIFLRCLAKHHLVTEHNPLYAARSVKLGWARFSEKRFDFVTRQIQDYQPVTLIETCI